MLLNKLKLFNWNILKIIILNYNYKFLFTIWKILFNELNIKLLYFIIYYP